MKRSALPVLLATGALVLTGCSGGTSATDGADASGAASDSPVTLTAPAGQSKDITFDSQPKNLVMDCYAYSSLKEYGVTPKALFGYDCENPFVMGDTDISGIERIGTDGEIDMEKLAALKPDAVIGQGSEKGWSWFKEDVNAQLTKVSTFVPLPKTDSIDEGITATRDLAKFFGGDVTSSEVEQSDKDYEQAKKDFKAAVGKKDLSFMLTSPTKESLYTAVGFPQADLLEEQGATITGAAPPKEGNPWGDVAWEKASTYPADVILVEGYSEDKKFSTEMWDSLPAVKAEQLGSWGSKGAMTARHYADWLQDITELTEKSSKVS